MHTVSPSQFHEIFPDIPDEQRGLMSDMTEAVNTFGFDVYAIELASRGYTMKSSMNTVGVVLPSLHDESIGSVRYAVGQDGIFRQGLVTFTGMRIDTGSLGRSYEMHQLSERRVWMWLADEPLFVVRSLRESTTVTNHSAALQLGEDEVLFWARNHPPFKTEKSPVLPRSLKIMRDESIQLYAELGGKTISAEQLSA